MKKSKKSLKGMTLVEMIISIAIFAIMGGLLVLVGTHIDSTNRATNVLKSKISTESPYAANKKTGYRNKDGVDKVLAPSDMAIDISITEIGDTASVTLEAEKFNTRDIVEDGLDDTDKTAIRNKANGGLNFQFVRFKSTDEEVDPESESGVESEGDTEEDSEGESDGGTE